MKFFSRILRTDPDKYAGIAWPATAHADGDAGLTPDARPSPPPAAAAGVAAAAAAAAAEEEEEEEEEDDDDDDMLIKFLEFMSVGVVYTVCGSVQWVRQNLIPDSEKTRKLLASRDNRYCTHSRDTSLQTVHYSTKYYVQLSTDHFKKKKKRV